MFLPRKVFGLLLHFKIMIHPPKKKEKTKACGVVQQGPDQTHLLWLWSWLRCCGCMFSLHLGHEGKGCQAGGRPPYSGSTDANSAHSHCLSDGALRLRGWGLLGVETLGVTAWRGDLVWGKFHEYDQNILCHQKGKSTVNILYV